MNTQILRMVIYPGYEVGQWQETGPPEAAVAAGLQQSRNSIRGSVPALSLHCDDRAGHGVVRSVQGLLVGFEDPVGSRFPTAMCKLPCCDAFDVQRVGRGALQPTRMFRV